MRWFETGVAGPIGVVPNAVDVEQFHAARRGKQETPTIGMLYAPVRFKGCDIGFAAFELAKKSVPHLRMVCLSDPEAPPGLPDGVEFVSRPSQDRIRDVYAACDAWLFCSRSEGFGLPILEAMACRTPVIAHPRARRPTLFRRVEGCSFRTRIHARWLTRFVASWPCRRRNGFRCRRRPIGPATSYSWDDAVARFERELERAIEGNRSGAARLGALRE
jgi:hypothetical protein